MVVKKRRGGDSKLDMMLKEGASQKKPTVDVDKAVSSTTHRLLREKLPFAKASATVNTAEQYKRSGFILLEPQNEENASRRLKLTPKSKNTSRSKSAEVAPKKRPKEQKE